METESALFIPLHPTSWNVMIPLAVEMRQSTSVQPIILVSNQFTVRQISELQRLCLQYTIVDQKLINCNNNNVIGNSSNSVHNIDTKKVNSSSKPKEFIKNLFSFAVGLRYITKEALRLKTYYRNTIEVMSRYNISTIVTMGDRHYGYELSFLRYCLQYGKKSVIVPIAKAASPTAIAIASRNNKNLDASLHLLLRTLFPRQCYYDSISEKLLFYYKPSEMIALYLNRMLPANPWVIGGGASQRVLVDGEEALDALVTLGCEPQKIEITGHSSHDTIFHAFTNQKNLKAELIQEYGFGARNIIVLALPQLAEHNILGWDEHWQEIEFLMQSVSNIDSNVLISLHPKMDYNEYAKRAERFDLAISRKSLAQIIPVADIFMSTFSSTVQWSILCEIPTLIFDFYNLNYKIYDFAFPGVLVIRDKNVFESTLRNIHEDEVSRINMTNYLKSIKHKISPFDGKCTSRILKNIVN
jgi:hypothetical protein